MKVPGKDCQEIMDGRRVVDITLENKMLSGIPSASIPFDVIGDCKVIERIVALKVSTDIRQDFYGQYNEEDKAIYHVIPFFRTT